jgi:hypothetical protein
MLIDNKKNPASTGFGLNTKKLFIVLYFDEVHARI